MKFLEWILAPLIFIDCIIYYWNKNFFSSDTIAGFQSGRASGFAMALLLSPMLTFSTREYFIAYFVGFSIIVFSTSVIIDKVSTMGNIKNNINEFVSKKPTKASSLACGIFVLLIIWAISFVALGGRW